MEARLRGLHDLYQQGRRMAEQSPEGMTALMRGWEGLDMLAAAYAICFAGPDIIARYQAQESGALRKVRMLQSVLEAVADDLNHVYHNPEDA